MRAGLARAWWARGWVKPTIAIALLVPLVDLAFGAMANTLGPNPAEALIRGTGDWALRMLCLALAVTPVRVLTGLPELARFRRMVGLLAYLYASVHLMSYVWLDMEFVLSAVWRDIVKRPFITVGFLTWALLTALAATSTDSAVRRLGARAWRALHRLVYPAAVLAVLHFFWMRVAKQNLLEVAAYAAIVFTLLSWRVWHASRSRPVKVRR